MANYTNLRVEPPDHAIGRSRGGLSTKIHHLCDGLGRPLVLLVGPGQGGDSPMFLPLLASLQVPRLGPGRPRTRPVKVLADKAYSSRANRSALRERGITAVIAEPSDQQANRKRRGRHGGRPPAFDTDAYRDRNVVERSFNAIKQWRGLATRYDKLALTYRGGVVLAAILTWLRALGDVDHQVTQPEPMGSGWAAPRILASHTLSLAEVRRALLRGRATARNVGGKRCPHSRRWRPTILPTALQSQLGRRGRARGTAGRVGVKPVSVVEQGAHDRTKARLELLVVVGAEQELPSGQAHLDVGL